MQRLLAGRVMLLPLVLVSLSYMPSTAADEPAAKASTSYWFGVFPYLSLQRIRDVYGPIGADFSRVLAREVRLRTTSSFSRFTHNLEHELYDIALIQPFDYPVAHEHGYVPLARVDEPLLTYFVVRADNPAARLEDLRGGKIALPPPPAATTRMGLLALDEAGLVPGDDVQIQYFRSHDACMQDVLIGAGSACATGRAAVAMFEQRMQTRLRVLFKTAALPHMVFVAHERLPAQDRKALHEAITSWHTTSAGRAVIGGTRFEKYTSATAADYAAMSRYAAQSPAPPANVAPREGLVLGVFPYLAPKRLSDRLAPLPKALGAAARGPVHLRTTLSYAKFMDQLRAGRYDLVVVQPFDFELAVKHGYVPLARMQGGLQAVFYVAENSPLQALPDLKGKTVAMPPAEAAVSRMACKALRSAGLAPARDVEIRYRRSHDSCLQRLQAGAVSACVTTPVLRRVLAPEETAGLRELTRTPAIPHVVFAAHGRLSPAIQAAIEQAVLSWAHTRDGRELLRTIGFDDFVPVDPADYASLGGDWEHSF